MRNTTLRRGITLIEVVASLALTATLLVTLLQTKAGAAQRAANARQTLAAVDVADQMLATWSADPSSIPAPANGDLPNGLRWRTRFVPNVVAAALGVKVVRLELFSGLRIDAPLVSVDVLQNPPTRVRAGN